MNAPRTTPAPTGAAASRSQPSLLKMTYSGPMTTGKGIIIVASITANEHRATAQRIRENP